VTGFGCCRWRYPARCCAAARSWGWAWPPGTANAANTPPNVYPGFSEKPKGLSIGFGWCFLEGFLMVLAFGGLYQLLRRVLQ
jgi:hypothetical protein